MGESDECVKQIPRGAEQKREQQARDDEEVVDPAPLRIAKDDAAYEKVKGQVVDPSGQHELRPSERARDVFEGIEFAQDAGQKRRDQRDVDDGDAELNDVAVNERARAAPAGVRKS